MEAVMYCLVDPAGRLHFKAGADSYADVAHSHGLDLERCDKYRFDLRSRRLVVDVGTAAAERLARDYLDEAAGTASRLMKFAGAGHLAKDVLASLLAGRERQAYLAACAAIEREFTDACGAGGTCLPGGCAVAGEACLQPLIDRDVEYHKACGAEWVRRFAPLGHRIDAWKH